MMSVAPACPRYARLSAAIALDVTNVTETTASWTRSRRQTARTISRTRSTARGTVTPRRVTSTATRSADAARRAVLRSVRRVDTGNSRDALSDALIGSGTRARGRRDRERTLDAGRIFHA